VRYANEVFACLHMRAGMYKDDFRHKAAQLPQGTAKGGNAAIGTSEMANVVPRRGAFSGRWQAVWIHRRLAGDRRTRQHTWHQEGPTRAVLGRRGGAGGCSEPAEIATKSLMAV
jgi:hypothetical protein